MKMRIGTRILLGFGIMVALTIGLGWYNIEKQAAARSAAAEMENHDLVALAELARIVQSEHKMRSVREFAVAQHLLRRTHLPARDPAILQEEWRRMRDEALSAAAKLENDAAAHQKQAVSSRRGAQWEKIRQSAAVSHQALRELTTEAEARFGLVRRGQLDQLVARLPILERLQEDFDNKSAAVIRLVQEQVELGRGETQLGYDQARTSTLMALAAAVLLGVVFSSFIQRSITRPLGSFMQFVERVGQGDLTQQAPVTGADELSDLGRSLNQMVTGLKEVAGQTRGAAENLSSATTEILASTQQQAAGAAEQSAAVQQSTATMTEITQSGAQISERARQVATAAEATSAASTAGQQAVQSTTRIMEAIREQAEAVAENVVALSEKNQTIGEIIATVNDIAEQSHLLALNAAIEAAAAGEHGRSFTVVANEIKNLADQSKEATVQVRSILGDIQKGINSSVMLTEEAVKRAESGKQQADIADRTIRQLTDNIQQSIQAFQQIVAGAGQQQIGFEQVTQAVRNTGQASEQTAASTRQLEKAAAQVNAMAQQLRKAVERYRI